MTTHSTSHEVDGHGFERALASGPAAAAEKRTFGLGIWWLALGYFVFYAPYAALTRIFSQGLLPGLGRPASPFEMLPATGFATAVVTLLIITVLGWWRYMGRRNLWGVTVPWPMRRTLLAGLATAAIIYATTLMYTFTGVSVLLALLLMRSGVLILAPAVDCLFRKRVRWFSWTALGLCLLAVIATAAELQSYDTTWGLLVTVGIYVGAYAVRLPCLNALAKTTECGVTYRYFVEEQFVATSVLIAAPLAIALVGSERRSARDSSRCHVVPLNQRPVASSPDRSPVRASVLVWHADLSGLSREYVLHSLESVVEFARRSGGFLWDCLLVRRANAYGHGTFWNSAHCCRHPCALAASSHAPVARAL